MLVAGDISPSGDRILLRRAKNEGAWMWNRNPSMSVEDTLTTTGSCDLDLIDEPQGEAVAISYDEASFYTSSEEQNQPIYEYFFFLMSVSAQVGY